MDSIIKEIQLCETRYELDQLRNKVVQTIEQIGERETAVKIQTAFIKQKNKVRR